MKSQKNSKPSSRRPQTAIVYDGPYFAMIPQALIRDPYIHSTAKALFALYHSYSQKKELGERVLAYVSQKTLAENLGVTTRTIISVTKTLEQKRWVSVHRRGLNESNIILLHGRKKNKK